MQQASSVTILKASGLNHNVKRSESESQAVSSRNQRGVLLQEVQAEKWVCSETAVGNKMQGGILAQAVLAVGQEQEGTGTC